MTNRPARIEVSVTNDPRLLAALATIVMHSARRAGLGTAAQECFTEAAIEACKETFPLLHSAAEGNGTLRVVLEDHQDRVEMAIEHSGEALPTAGLDTFCAHAAIGAGGGLSGALQVKKVDRVQYETRDGVSRVVLIKYTGVRPLESASGA